MVLQLVNQPHSLENKGKKNGPSGPFGDLMFPQLCYPLAQLREPVNEPLMGSPSELPL